MKLSTALRIWAALALLATTPATAQVSNPLFSFCTQPKPSDEVLAAFYESQCPAILSLAVQTANQSLEATTATTEAALREKDIAALKQLFPASSPAENKASNDLTPLAHVAAYRQYQLLDEIGGWIRSELNETATSSSVVVLSGSEVNSLRTMLVSPADLSAEIGNLSTRIATIAQACKSRPSPQPAINARLFGGVSSAVIIADSLLGLSLKVSQAFQTILTGGTSSSLSNKTDSTSVISHSIANQWTGPGDVFIGWPSISDHNAIRKAVKDLQTQAWNLIEEMSKVDQKHPCLGPGKATLEAMHDRMKTLGTASDAATPSPLLMALRAAELDAIANGSRTASTGAVPAPAQPHQVLLLAIDPVHTGGSVIATKTAFTSQRYMRLATAIVTYRAETLTGRTVLAGVIRSPGGSGAADRQRLGRHIETVDTPSDAASSPQHR